jgi:hypothetical protein
MAEEGPLVTGGLESAWWRNAGPPAAANLTLVPTPEMSAFGVPGEVLGRCSVRGCQGKVVVGGLAEDNPGLAWCGCDTCGIESRARILREPDGKKARKRARALLDERLSLSVEDEARYEAMFAEGAG